MGDREATDTFLRNEAYTQTDAVHPRFMEEQDPSVIRDYEIRNYYYCEACQLFFAPTFRGLKTHFDGEMVQHGAYASCFYCQGSVYTYKLNNEQRLYHNCSDYKRQH